MTDVLIEPYPGPREDLRALFELADDSPSELASYLHAGQLLVARSGDQLVGHLLLVDTGTTGEVELKSMAVREDVQGTGIGARLVSAALDLLREQGATLLLVATGAADVGNLRFYQRQGFRVRAVERDAFTPATGYPDDLMVDGIPLRDRVWFDQPV